MNRSMNKVIVLAILISLMPVRGAFAYRDGDFQIWNTEVEEFKLNKDFKLGIEEEFRWGGDASELYYQHYQIGLAYNANRYLDLGVSYRQIYDKKLGKFKEENRPQVDITPKVDLHGFKLQDRNRFEYRHFRYQDDYCTYRNKFTAKYPLTLSKVDLEPYLADELFFDLKDKGGFTKNRLYSGLGISLTKILKAEVYYLLQTSKSSGSWVNANVLGTKLKAAF